MDCRRAQCARRQSASSGRHPSRPPSQFCPSPPTPCGPLPGAAAAAPCRAGSPCRPTHSAQSKVIHSGACNMRKSWGCQEQTRTLCNMPWGISGSSLMMPFVLCTSSTRQRAGCMLGLQAAMADRGCLWRGMRGRRGRARSLKWCMWSPRKLECLYGGTLLNLLSTCQRSRMSSISRSHQKSLRRCRACPCVSRRCRWRARPEHTLLHMPGSSCRAEQHAFPLAMHAGQRWHTRDACSLIRVGRVLLPRWFACVPRMRINQHWHAEALGSRLHVCSAALAKA